MMKDGFKKAVQDVRRGLPYSRATELQQRAHLSPAQMASLLGIPERTMGRRRTRGRLMAHESDRLDRTHRTIDLVVKVLGEENANAWLQQSNQSFGGETPVSQLDTDVGVRAVEEELLRIERERERGEGG
jgi:putative toxin-antitoxin system antitoxin component (TIGR02293 family)